MQIDITAGAAVERNRPLFVCLVEQCQDDVKPIALGWSPDRPNNRDSPLGWSDFMKEGDQPGALVRAVLCDRFESLHEGLVEAMNDRRFLWSECHFDLRPKRSSFAKRMTAWTWLGTVLLACICRDLPARVYSPRVVSEYTADCYSLKTFSQFARWRDLTGDARVWEIYRYLADRHTGLFHMNEVLEGCDAVSEFRTIRDPVKIINVYGYGYCGIFGPVMAGVAEGTGIGPARTLVLRDWNHVLAETYYDDRWHYLDVDVRAVFRRPDGSLASMKEAQQDPTLWVGRGPLFFPNDPLEQTRKIYENTPVERYHGFHITGHTMDYVLRQGESFKRWWNPQGGRWNHRQEYNKSSWLRKLLEDQPRGPKPNHGHFTIHNHGNGRIRYCPNLTSKSSDFADGVYDFSNVQPSVEGLALVNPGTGYAVFEVRSPYVIVPRVGDIDTTADDCEASVIDIDASHVQLEISLDNGVSWISLDKDRDVGRHGRRSIDLSTHVAGRYGYLLRIALKGKPNESLVRGLSLTTWVQVAPAALPSLRPGINRMTLRCGDHYGLSTRVMEIQPETSRRDELLKWLVDAPEDYDPSRTTDRVRGTIVAKVPALPNTKIEWLSAGASFRTHQLEAAATTGNRIAYAVDDANDFKEVYRAHVPAYCQHWHYNADCEIKLEKPADIVYVRYDGKPAVNRIRVYAHCSEKRSCSDQHLLVTHVWTENGKQKQQQSKLTESGDYQVVVGEDCEDESIEFSLESQ